MIRRPARGRTIARSSPRTSATSQRLRTPGPPTAAATPVCCSRIPTGSTGRPLPIRPTSSRRCGRSSATLRRGARPCCGGSLEPVRRHRVPAFWRSVASTRMDPFARRRRHQVPFAHQALAFERLGSRDHTPQPWIQLAWQVAQRIWCRSSAWPTRREVSTSTRLTAAAAGSAGVVWNRTTPACPLRKLLM